MSSPAASRHPEQSLFVGEESLAACNEPPRCPPCTKALVATPKTTLLFDVIQRQASGEEGSDGARHGEVPCSWREAGRWVVQEVAPPLGVKASC